MSYDLDGDDAAPLDPNKCAVCSAEPEPGFAMPLCAPCRAQLVRRPIPKGIWITAGLVGGLMLLALMRFPGQLRAARAFERGTRHQQAGRWVEASGEFRTARAHFGDASRILVPLLESLAPQQDRKVVAEAEGILEKLEGREANREEIQRVKTAVNRLETTIKALEKGGK